jgi:serine/threonine-protein kinase
MSSCPACATPASADYRYCPACGTDLELPDNPTSTAPGRSPAPPSPARAAAGSDPARGKPSFGDRFVPGTILAERYRIVGLLGRGGMGEVYRADDLKLEQPVALKFLTRALERDPARIERLYGEVRTARQVSHPAVCRVWDIGEADGQHFLSMEFVDGENLSSLMRRIGRFPIDKALDVSRQVAEGLAAAHAKGLLHRDLKPANVMLDGQGQVRLTDFGLAGLAETLTREDVQTGTPAYMSPEQLLGREVSVRSDIYALGLVIYELVTGRRAFEGKGFAELARKHRDERPIEPSALVRGLDPVIERTILACLEKEPRKRPPTALSVAAMLSGRDPLEAAIAAGETPSPELVAAAGETEGLGPRAAWLCLLATVLGVLAFPALQEDRHPLARVPVEKSPATLEDRARELLSRLGAGKPLDFDVGFSYDLDYVRWVTERDRSPRRWDVLATGEPPLVGFWYRQGPRPIQARNLGGKVSWSDPEASVAGMAGASYDLTGRLVAFYAVPPQLERPEAPSPAAVSGGEADWAPLFAEARLDPARFERVQPEWTPPFYADARAAWQGRWPARSELPLRVEAASYRGRPVSFELRSEWARPEREQTSTLTAVERRIQACYIVLLVVLCAVAAVLAYRNISLGRGDRRGAFRLALGLASLGTASWALRAHHVADPAGEIAGFTRGAGLSVLVASLLWLFYLALEPYVRRLRPWTLVSWTRLLNGGVRDAVVGRDVLVGLAFGTGLTLVSLASRQLFVWMGEPGRPPELVSLDLLLSTRLLLSYVAGLPVTSTLAGLALLLLFLILRLLTRRDWIAAPLVVGFLVAGEFAEGRDLQQGLWLVLPLAAVAWGAFMLLMLRFGVLAAITGVWCTNILRIPALLYAPGSWAGTAVFVIVPLLLATAVLAFRSATGGHLGVKRYLAGEAYRSRPA